MLPTGSSVWRLLNQSTHCSAANSTASNDRHGPCVDDLGLVETVDGFGESHSCRRRYLHVYTKTWRHDRQAQSRRPIDMMRQG